LLDETIGVVGFVELKSRMCRLEYFRFADLCKALFQVYLGHNN